MQHLESPSPFCVSLNLPTPFGVAIGSLLERPINHVLGMPSLQQAYGRARSEEGGSFPRQVLNAMGITTSLSESDLKRVPKTGGVIIVANHPFGGIEGLVLADQLGRVRNDVRLLANGMLNRIPEMRPHLISINPFEGSDAKTTNVSGIRAAAKWLQSGGALVVFPSGTVSHWHARRRRVTDPKWQDGAARLARMTQTGIVPIHIAGRNSLSFQLAGIVHPLLRTMMLPSQLLKHKNKTISLRIGTRISPQRVGAFNNTSDLTEYLRFRTYLLGSSLSSGTSGPRPLSDNHEPVTPETTPDAGISDLEKLPEDQHLIVSGPWRVSWCRAPQMPALLPEIGRLREVTFRAVGEGTGNAVDLDRFDQTYRHLIVWHADDRRVVGAYRAGCTDEVPTTQDGMPDLYTSQLFRIKPGFFAALPPAVELGRSFVRVEYQKQFQPLLLLWQGIGHMLARELRYQTLFGPVSISDEYCRESLEVIRQFLEKHRLHGELSRQVQPRKKLKRTAMGDANPRRILGAVSEVEALTDWIKDLESNGRGIPVLLRQYLRLGGRIAAFNVDPEFNDVLDAMIVVDMTAVSPALQAKYMGKAGALAYAAHHAKS